MTMQHQHPVATARTTGPSGSAALENPEPSAAEGALTAHRRPGENVRAALEVDLDAQLRFAGGLLQLTDQRLLALDPGQQTPQEWALTPDLSLHLSDQAGLGLLELTNAQGRLALWRFTLRNNLQAQRFQDAFNTRDLLAAPPSDDAQLCPSCQAVL
ncbi:MAG: ABC transporter, partial [Burkholderiaceae bacterium]